MIKKILPVAIIFLILGGFYYLLTSSRSSSVNTNDSNTVSDGLVLFYGSTCPHCKIVEEFITNNQIDQKIKISQLEVYENKTNQESFVNLVKEVCPDQITTNGLPVPFLVDQKEKKCTVGDTDTISYLTEKSK